MTVQVNGEPWEIAGPVTVAGLLATLGLNPQVVAVELNRTVVKRARYAETPVAGGDEIEIVAFVGGG
jgi:thiamine biosynthesis protein ThiS